MRRHQRKKKEIKNRRREREKKWREIKASDEKRKKGYNRLV